MPSPSASTVFSLSTTSSHASPSYLCGFALGNISCAFYVWLRTAPHFRCSACQLLLPFLGLSSMVWIMSYLSTPQLVDIAFSTCVYRCISQNSCEGQRSTMWSGSLLPSM